MNDDEMFRRILLGAMICVIPVGLYYRLRSQATGEPLDRWQEGKFILFTLRPMGALTAIGLVAYVINPAWMAWSSVPLPVPVRWTGVALGAASVGLLIWTFHTLGRNLTDTVVTRREHSLVTHGPYAWVRHPFYDAAGMAILGNALAARNWFVLTSGALGFALIVLRTRREEARLLARFGDAYRAYSARTGRFLPRIR